LELQVGPARTLAACGTCAFGTTAAAWLLCNSRRPRRPDAAHERGFLLAVAAQIARQDNDPDADRLAEQAREALELLGVRVLVA
jgi:hypothetical protein